MKKKRPISYWAWTLGWNDAERWNRHLFAWGVGNGPDPWRRLKR